MIEHSQASMGLGSLAVEKYVTKAEEPRIFGF